MDDSDSFNRGQETGMMAETGEAVTPAARFFLQPELETVINCAVGFKFPLDIAAAKSVFEATFLRHPRFCSIVVKDKNGVEHWKRSDVDIDKHLIFPKLLPFEIEDENFPNKYIADLAIACPLDRKKPLWEVHILEHNCKGTRSCCIFRMHHSLGDGISLMSLFLASCRRVDEPNLLPTIPSHSMPTHTYVHKFNALICLSMLWKLVLIAWFTLIDFTHFLLHGAWLKDSKSPIYGGAGVELWPKKLSVATFNFEDMHAVKKAVNGTINDVLLGIISSGFRQYLELHYIEISKNGSFENLRFTGLAMVNTRASPGLQHLSNMMRETSKARWGNQMGYVLLPLSLAKFKDPLDYVRKAKVMLDRKKLSFGAYFSYKIGELTTKLLGLKVATSLSYNTIASSSFTISNIVGPTEEIMFADNPITYISPTVSNVPQGIIMHMLSYMGKARMQILVAKDIIPDPEILARCFEASLQDMKEAIPRE